MTNTARYESPSEADPELPTVRIVRGVRRPGQPRVPGPRRPRAGQAVVRAAVDRDGHRDVGLAHGGYRRTALRDGEAVAHCYGSVHRVWANERIVQTFGFEEMPESVGLDTAASSTSAKAAAAWGCCRS